MRSSDITRHPFATSESPNWMSSACHFSVDGKIVRKL